MKKKIFSLVLALSLLCALLTGCVNTATAGSINGKPIKPGVLNLAIASSVSTIAQSKGGIYTYAEFEALDFDGVSAKDKAINDAYDLLKELYTAEAMLEAEGVTLTDSDMSQVNGMVESVKKGQGGEAKFKNYLKLYDATEDDLREYYRLAYIQYRLQNVLSEKWASDYSDSEALLDEFEQTYLKAKHILFSTEGKTDEEKEEIKKTAQETLDKIHDGEDFDSFSDLNDDPGATQQPDGYVFKEGDMVTEFYDGTKALEVGAISPELVESSFGYHIIKRLSVTEDPEDFANTLPTMIQIKVSERMSDLIKEQSASTTVERNDKQAQKADIKKMCFSE